MDYSTLLTTVADWLNRSDLTSQIPYFINSAMHKLERKYNFRHMKVRATATLAANAYLISNPIPNYKKFIHIVALDSSGDRTTLTKKSLNYCLEKYGNYTSDIGTPELIADVADIEATLTPDALPTQKLLIRPTPTAAYTIELYAYQYSPDLDGSTYTTNWWTQYAWEILLYGALLDAEPFLGSDARIATWKTLMDEAIKDLANSEIEEEVGGHQHIESNYVV